MSEEIELPAQNYGPGNVLRAKREEYEWSIEAVAEALHLSTSSVRAIEADRYEDLPGATYVIGYWRSYARLLGIDIEDTIEANKRNLSIVVPEAAGIDVNKAHRQSSGGGWLGLVLLIGLIGFAYYAWQQQFFGLLDQVKWFRADQPVASQNLETEGNNAQQAPNINETQVLRPADQGEEQVSGPQIAEVLKPALNPSIATKSEDESSQLASNSILRPVENNAMSSNLSEPATQNPQPGGSVQQGLVLPPSGNQGQPSSAAGNTSNFLQNQTGNTSLNNLAPQQNNAGTLAAQDTPTAGLQNAINDAAAADGTTMFLTLNKDSWLDIRDKTNKRLIYRTETAGQQLTVKGTPPFYVYIGTPSGVKITYKGQDVPFETHKSGLFARFKLGDTLESL